MQEDFTKEMFAFSFGNWIFFHKLSTQRRRNRKVILPIKGWAYTKEIRVVTKKGKWKVLRSVQGLMGNEIGRGLSYNFELHLICH
jgi:hypothetical protein